MVTVRKSDSPLPTWASFLLGSPDCCRWCLIVNSNTKQYQIRLFTAFFFLFHYRCCSTISLSDFSSFHPIYIVFMCSFLFLSFLFFFKSRIAEGGVNDALLLPARSQVLRRFRGLD